MKLSREDLLDHAYRLARRNGVKPGVNGEDFPDIEAYGAERWLGELAQALKEKRYRASPLRRVYLPKANGKQRPLGIPTIQDRVVQTAAVLVLAPIFETDQQPKQYAYREGRGAQDAVRDVHKRLNTGYKETHLWFLTVIPEISANNKVLPTYAERVLVLVSPSRCGICSIINSLGY
jgi:retron-type reverse transcriptase